MAGEPRIFELAITLIAHTEGRVELANLELFIAAAQEISPLSLGELWAVPAMMRLALIENIRRMTLRTVRRLDELEDADAWAARIETASENGERALREALGRELGVEIAVIVSDTFGRPWRLGQIDFAIGAAGIDVLDDYVGRRDWSGRVLEHTVIATADQLAAAAGLVMGKAEGVPAVVLRGYAYRSGASGAAQLVRPRDEDLFR